MTTELTTEEIREYTERAAKRMDLEFTYGWLSKRGGLVNDPDTLFYRNDKGIRGSFDPAHNDADSRRLARTLRIDVRVGKNRVSAWSDELGGQVTRYEPTATLDQIGAAERLAVLRVAGRE